MTKVEIDSVDAYIAAQPEESRAVLTRVREAIRKALPAADESISYNMPTYKLLGKPVLYFAGWKRHYSLYPITDAVAGAFAAELAPYTLEKATLRFPLDKPVPTTLIGSVAKLRESEVRERSAAG